MLHYTQTKVITKRIPKLLLPYTNGKKFYKKKVLDYEVDSINSLFTESLQLVKLGKSPSNEWLQLFGDTSRGSLFCEELALSRAFQRKGEEYLLTLSVSTNVMNEYRGILTTIDTLLGSVLPTTCTDIDRLKQYITNLPRRNIKRYVGVPVNELIGHHIPLNDRLSNKTINGYLKVLKSLLKYLHLRGHIQLPLYDCIKMLPLSNARTQREPLTPDEIQLLIDKVTELKPHILPHLMYLIYTGVRPSELVKGSITYLNEQNGTLNGLSCTYLCFDLTNPKQPLKTHSSYRTIPLHYELHKYLELEYYTPSYLTRTLTYIIKEYINTNKSSYSIRHSFATQLIQSGTNPSIVSELMGHTHQSMTLNRYAKGFSLEQLYSGITSLY